MNKKRFYLTGMLLIMLLHTSMPANAQIPIIDIIKAAIKKAIKAADLQIQRQQNKIIWLQNAQKTLENEMSKLKLDQIKDWVSKQKELYQKYYEELAKVKAVISYYQRIRDITRKQVKLVEQYKQAWSLLQQDRHFSADELQYMSKVYTGIMKESLQNLDQITLVITSSKTKMTDAKRLDLINEAADRIEMNYNDLTRFSNQNKLLSLQRSRSVQEAAVVRKMYGL